MHPSVAMGEDGANSHMLKQPWMLAASFYALCLFLYVFFMCNKLHPEPGWFIRSCNQLKLCLLCKLLVHHDSALRSSA